MRKLHLIPCFTLSFLDEGIQDVPLLFNIIVMQSHEEYDVTCCKNNDNTSISVRCGDKRSCLAACNVNDAFFCPTGTCEDCLHFTFVPQIEEPLTRTTECAASSQSSCTNRCVKDGCKVKSSPSCCYHPVCRSRRKKQCKWTDDYTGACEI